LISVVRI